MAVALEFAASLGDLLIWAGAFILASLLLYMLVGIAHGLSGAVSWIPGVGDAASGFVNRAADPIIDELDSLRSKSDAEMAKALSFLADSLAIGFGLAILLGLGVKLAFAYLWHHAIRPLILALVAPVLHIAQQALGLVEEVPRLIETALGRAERYAVGEAEKALSVAETFAARAAHAAEASAAKYADEAVGKLRAIEDSAIAEATRLGNAGIAAAATAEAGAIAQAEAYADAAVGAAVGTIDIGIGAIGGEVRTVEEQIASLNKLAGVGGIAALIAAIPALQILVHAIAEQAGLGSAECRGKVKGICGTSSGAWENLLGLFADIIILTDICHVLPLLEEGLSAVATPLVEGLTDVGAGLCSAGYAGPAALSVPTLHTPAAPGFTLALA